MSVPTTTASDRKRRSRALAVITVLVVGVAAAIAALILTHGGSTPEARALQLVERFETALDAGDFDTAHGYVDYRFRLAESLGELWESGDENARTELERLTRGMLVDTTKKVWPDCCHGRPMERTIKSSADGVIWVESRPGGVDAPNFIWRYRLNGGQEAWQITQRDYVKDRVPNDTTRFWPMAVKGVALKLGRAPNLSEFQANLLSVMPTLKVRTFFVPDKLPAKPSPKKSDVPEQGATAP